MTEKGGVGQVPDPGELQGGIAEDSGQGPPLRDAGDVLPGSPEDGLVGGRLGGMTGAGTGGGAGVSADLDLADDDDA